MAEGQDSPKGMDLVKAALAAHRADARAKAAQNERGVRRAGRAAQESMQ